MHPEGNRIVRLSGFVIKAETSARIEVDDHMRRASLGDKNTWASVNREALGPLEMQQCCG